MLESRYEKEISFLLRLIVRTFRRFDPICFSVSLKWSFVWLVLIWFRSLRVRCQPLITRVLKLYRGIIDFIRIVKTFCLVRFLLRRFWFLSCLNLQGLLPFGFTVRRHLWLAIFLALSVWLCRVSGQIIDSFNQRISHLVPHGSPLRLGSLLVLIELVRLRIRPITLGVRLIANMISGHILLHLSEGIVNYSSLRVVYIVLPIYVLEVAVALIQAYVFTVLTLLYIEEVYIYGSIYI